MRSPAHTTRSDIAKSGARAMDGRRAGSEVRPRVGGGRQLDHWDPYYPVRACARRSGTEPIPLQTAASGSDRQSKPSAAVRPPGATPSRRRAPAARVGAGRAHRPPCGSAGPTGPGLAALAEARLTAGLPSRACSPSPTGSSPAAPSTRSSVASVLPSAGSPGANAARTARASGNAPRIERFGPCGSRRPSPRALRSRSCRLPRALILPGRTPRPPSAPVLRARAEPRRARPSRCAPGGGFRRRSRGFAMLGVKPGFRATYTSTMRPRTSSVTGPQPLGDLLDGDARRLDLLGQ